MNFYSYKDALKYKMDATLVAENGESFSGEFMDVHVDPDTVPKGKFMYACRHTDYNWIKPATIERSVNVNFAGCFVTNTPINLAQYDFEIVHLREALLK